MSTTRTDSMTHTRLPAQADGTPGEAGGDATVGLVRRARRTADLSQRALAAKLGVSQSTVARWETGRTSPRVADLQRVLALAGTHLAMLDVAGDRVIPMREDAARDRGGRRYPAHVDPVARGWWLPPGAHLTADGWQLLQRSRSLGDVRVAYDLGLWREVLRGLFGMPADHPHRDDLVAAARAETSHPPDHTRR